MVSCAIFIITNVSKTRKIYVFKLLLAVLLFRIDKLFGDILVSELSLIFSDCSSFLLQQKSLQRVLLFFLVNFKEVPWTFHQILTVRNSS